MKPLAFSLLLLLGACAGTGAGAPRSDDQRQQDATTAACRQEAERTMRYRDRGQLMRTDEAEARIGAGAFTDAVAGSMSTQRLSSRYEQSRLVDDCVRGANAAPASPAPAAAPVAEQPAPAPVPMPTARRARGR
jgi:hypothetical protein